MTIVEFAEAICGGKLPLWQKELLMRYDAMPRDCRLVWYNGTFHIIKEDDDRQNGKGAIMCKYSKGLGEHLHTVIDENTRAFPNPEIVFEKNDLLIIRNHKKSKGE